MTDHPLVQRFGAEPGLDVETDGTAPGLVDSLPAELRFRWKDQDHAESVPPGVSS